MSATKLYHRHFKQLGEIAISCIIKSKTYFFYTFPLSLQFPKDFPIGIRVKDKCTKTTSTRRLNAKLVLEWLYNNGKSKVDVETIVREMVVVSNTINGLLTCTNDYALIMRDVK